MLTYQEILRRAMESQGRAQAALAARLDAGITLAPEDIAQGPERVAELAGEIVARLAEVAAHEMREGAARAMREVVMPPIASLGAGARLPANWQGRADRLIAFYTHSSTESLRLALDAYVTNLRLMVEEAEAMGWADGALGAVLLDDIRKPGPRWGAFRAAARKAVQEVAGHAWTATWVSAWRALEVAPSLIADVKPEPFGVIEGGVDG